MKTMKNVFMALLALAVVTMVSCDKDDDTNTDDNNNNDTETGIIGTWEATDISAVLTGLGYDDSLYVEFKDDDTYEVKSYISGIDYKIVGTYIQEKSDNGDIWDITLNQVSVNGAPYEVTSQGIFEVYDETPETMWYEIAQTNPEISGVTAPTAEAGFGSTSGGAFGTTNIQKYVRK